MEHGPQKCFRGLSPCIARDVSGFVVYMLSYQYFCRLSNQRGPDHCSFPVQFMAGGLAGVLSWMCNLPIDFIKSRLQADSLENPRFRNSYHAFETVMREEGIRAFYRGLPAVMARAFVINAVTLPVYTRCKPHVIRFLQGDSD